MRQSGRSAIILLLGLGLWLASWGHELFEDHQHEHAPEKLTLTRVSDATSEALATCCQVTIPVALIALAPSPEPLSALIARARRDDGPPARFLLPPGLGWRGPPPSA